MTYGIKAFRQCQMSREASTAQGTPTTDFVNWRGVASIDDTRETVFPEEDIGVFGGADRQYFANQGGQVVFGETEATFEQIGHVLDAAIYKATPTTDTGSGYIRTYTLPIASSDAKESTDLQTYSFKVGDNNEVQKASYGFVSEFGLSGAGGEALKLTATWLTRQVENDTAGFETGLAIPTVEEILFSKGTLYVDETSTDFGVTAISKFLLGCDLRWTTGWHAISTADGRADFSFAKQVRPEILLDLTFENNGSASAELAAYRANTARLIRLNFIGAALASSGVYTYKTLRIDLAGKWERFEPLDEQDGNDIIKATFRARYNATAAKFGEIVLVNEIASL